jgi:hypothetical protein
VRYAVWRTFGAGRPNSRVNLVELIAEGLGERTDRCRREHDLGYRAWWCDT